MLKFSFWNQFNSKFNLALILYHFTCLNKYIHLRYAHKKDNGMANIAGNMLRRLRRIAHCSAPFTEQLLSRSASSMIFLIKSF